LRATVADFGRLLIFLGIFLAVLGTVISLGGKIPWLGRLPGDIHMERENFSFYFPLATCLLISVILTLIFKIFRH
jgi:hypothetical protein